MNTYVVTCRTEECPNENVEIEVIKSADGDVLCGPCKEPITDIKLTQTHEDRIAELDSAGN